MYIVVMYLS